MKQQAIRVDDDDQERDGGMDAAGYVVALLVIAGVAFLIGAILWLPVIYRAAGRGL